MTRQNRIFYIYFANLLLLIFLFCVTSISPSWGLETRGVRHLFDLEETKENNLSLPTDVAIAPDGSIYVVDGGNHRVVKYASNGAFQYTLGGEKNNAAGLFNAPVGIGVDKDGKVYVADSGNYRVQVFSRDGKLIHFFSLLENKTKIKPIDVAISPDAKKIYVTGNTNHKVMVYTNKGKLVTTWGKKGNNPGEFRYPATIITDKNGSIYVVDVFNSRVQIFTPKGKLLTTVGSWGVLPGQLFRPKGIALDKHENIYITDSYMDLIEVFDNKTRFSHVLGAKGKIEKFTAPAGISIDNSNRIYITEMLENKVSVYALE